MIKLPIVLAEHSSWATTVAAAISTRKSLEEAAKATGDSVRPITLYQAQAKDKDDPTVITADSSAIISSRTRASILLTLLWLPVTSAVSRA